MYTHTEKSFQNLIKSNPIHILFTILKLIWNETDVRLVLNRSENGKYNMISVWLNKIPKKNPLYTGHVFTFMSQVASFYSA